MAQAVKMNLAHAQKQISEVHDSLKTPQPKYLGIDFSIVPIAQKVGYLKLVENLQTCLHNSQEPNRKQLVEKILTKLEFIAVSQNLETEPNVMRIHNLCMLTLSPPIEGKAPQRIQVIKTLALFQKYLSALLYAKEEALFQITASEQKLKVMNLQQQFMEHNKGRIKENSEITTRKHKGFTLPNCSSAEGMAFAFMFIKNTNLIRGKSNYQLDVRPEDRPLIENFLQHLNPEVRHLATNLLYKLQLDQEEQPHKFYKRTSAKVDALIKTDSETVQPLLFEQYPLFMNSVEMVRALDGEDRASLRKHVAFKSEIDAFDTHHQFTYRYLFAEYRHLQKEADREKPISGSFMSHFRDAAVYLPEPQDLDAYYARGYDEMWKLVLAHPEEEGKVEKNSAPAEASSASSKKKNKKKKPGILTPKREPKAEAPSSSSSSAASSSSTSELSSSSATSISSVASSSYSVSSSSSAASTSSVAPSAAAPAQHPIDAILDHRKEVPIIYSDRVNEQYALSGEKSHDVDAKWRHAFPDVLDQFLGTAYAKKGTWANRQTGHADTLYLIPGEVEVAKDVWKRCQFEWCVGKDGKCYHRFCSYKEKNTLLENWMSGTAFTEQNFPTLQQSYTDATWKGEQRKKIVENIRMELHHVLNFITFTDRETNISCRIFKVGR